MNDTYESYRDETPSDDLLQRISRTAKKQREIEIEIIEKTAELDSIRKQYEKISQVMLPDLMDEAGQKEITTSDGIRISVDKKYRASIPKNNPEPALKWLVDNNHEKIIKNEVTLNVGKGQNEFIDHVVSDIKKQNPDILIKQKKSVHASTLTSFVQQQIENGVDIPFKPFGIYLQKTTKLK